MNSNKVNLKIQIEKALRSQQSGQCDDALAIFEAILKDDPNQIDALHGIGLCWAEKGNYVQAITYFLKAIHLAPHIAPFHNNLANAYKAIGKINEALIHYQEALKLKSNYPQAHNNLGALYFRTGQYQQAALHFEKAIRMDPYSADSHYNFANTLVQLDQLSQAQTHFEKVLTLRPDHLGAMHNLSLTYTTLKAFDKALPLLESTLKREPKNLDVRFHLGLVYSALNRTEAAISQYVALLELYPHHGPAHHNLATIYLQLQNKEKALRHYQLALKENPENETAQHMVHALMGQTSMAAPVGYVRALFDQYAYNYDSHVKNKLNYQVPYLLRQAIAPFIRLQKKTLIGLDLGCGTGLCAPLFADVVGKLIGVDISPNMIDVARRAGGYFQLHCDDVLHFLEHHEQQFDIIIAADLLVYFGNLNMIFSQIHQHLTEKGIFVFNTELDSDQQDYQLQATGRYTHTETYIKSLCKPCFSILSVSKSVIRYQEDEPIEGNIFVLIKTTEISASELDSQHT